MVKRRTLGAHAFIGERLEKRDYRGFVVGAEAGALKVGINVYGGEIAAAAIEVHNLVKSGLAAIEEVRASELDVAQARSLYGPANRNGRTGGNGRSGKLSHGGKLRRGERSES